MQFNSLASEAPVGVPLQSGERRKNLRFDIHVPVLLRGIGDPWAVTETADVSATGAFFVVDRPFLLNTPIEYVLTFSPELTKASQPLRVRFFGMVLRCERVAGGNGSFGIAVRNTAHRYLTPDEASSYEVMERKVTSGSSARDKARSR